METKKYWTLFDLILVLSVIATIAIITNIVISDKEIEKEPHLCEVPSTRADGTISFTSTEKDQEMFVIATVNGPKMFVECTD